MKKFLFLLFVTLSLNALSTVNYTGISSNPWLKDVSIAGQEYNRPIVMVTDGSDFSMTLRTFAVDYMVTTCKVTLIFKNAFMPSQTVDLWSYNMSVYTSPYDEVDIELYGYMDSSIWPLGKLIVDIFVEDQNGYTLGAAQLEMFVL